jgi:hypothetical protein
VVVGFKGLNNRKQPPALGFEYQLQADNVLCDDSNYLVTRPGTSLLGSGYKDIHGTRDGRLLAIDASNNLVRINAAGEATVLHAGVTGAPFVWAELGYGLFLMSTTYKWAIYPDRKMAWGSLCPPLPTYSGGTLVSNPSATMDELGDPISYPPPYGQVLGTRRGQIIIAVWEPDRDRSVLYYSRPDFPHEFRIMSDFQLFAGQVTMLAEVSRGIVIGTDRAIYADPVDSPLVRLADYGVPFGGRVYDDRDTVYMWSERGLCKYPPFENMTGNNVSVVSRPTVTAAVLPWQGSEYAVVAQFGAVDDEPRTRAYESMEVVVDNLHGILD